MKSINPLMKKQIKYLTTMCLFFLLSSIFFSCESSSSDKIPSKDMGPTKIIFHNRTDYNLQELYIKKGSAPKSKADYGMELLEGKLLQEGSSLTLCPAFLNSSKENYHLTFVRQKGSTDHTLHITTEYPLQLTNDSGILEIDLLPYEFYYESKRNESYTCNEE